MSKVTVVGAGAVGATCANVMACREVASEVVLIDIKEGLSEGKMLDMYQCSTLMDFDTKLVGVTNDYKQTANSDVVVITSGIPRKPGMTREELIGTNANIMKGVIENVVKYSPRAIIIPGESHRRQHQQRGRHGDRRSWRYDDDSAAFEGFGQWRARDAIRLEEET